MSCYCEGFDWATVAFNNTFNSMIEHITDTAECLLQAIGYSCLQDMLPYKTVSVYVQASPATLPHTNSL